MAAISESFDVSPVPFSVGSNDNAAGSNMGSAKILSLGKLAALDQSTTLHLFGDYYRRDARECDSHSHALAGWCQASPHARGRSFSIQKAATTPTYEASCRWAGRARRSPMGWHSLPASQLLARWPRARRTATQ